MISFVFLLSSCAFFYLGNKAFNISIKFRKQTDPPSDFNEVENSQLFLLSILLLIAGCGLFFLFVKTVMPLLF